MLSNSGNSIRLLAVTKQAAASPFKHVVITKNRFNLQSLHTEYAWPHHRQRDGLKNDGVQSITELIQLLAKALPL